MLSYQLSSTSNIARLKIESLNLMLSQELIINHYFFFFLNQNSMLLDP